MNRRDFFKASGLLAIAAPILLNANNSFGDMYISKEEFIILQQINKRLKNVRRTVGFGNFNLLSFDEMISFSKNYSRIGAFSDAELLFMEKIFYGNPQIHGFYGKKTCENITDTINKKEVHKIPYTGHYLFKGKTTQTYSHMLKDIGDSIILTSGVRSIVKQFSLFLGKLEATKGNISEASKSIAPPAYSFHSIGDFDVGKKGYGYANFTPRFATTKEFYQMQKLNYIKMRYTINNKDGVRFEPWHVEII